MRYFFLKKMNPICKKANFCFVFHCSKRWLPPKLPYMSQQASFFWTGLIRGLGISLLLLLLGASLLFWLSDYPTFTDWALQWSGKHEWRSFFEEELFPASRYALLQQLFPFFSLTVAVALYLLWKPIKTWGNYLQEQQIGLQKDIRKAMRRFRQQPAWYRATIWALFLSFTILQFYGAAFQPLQYDEAWTYQHFTHRGPFIAAISPHNNHILYTLQSALLHQLPFLPTIWVIRLPVVLVGLATFWLLYFFLQWRWDDARVLWALSFWAFTPPSYFYQFLGRGYGLLIFFSLLSFASLWLWWKRPNKTYPLFLLGLASVLGVYSNIPFIYPMSACWLLLAILFFTRPNWSDFWPLFRMALLSFGAIVLLLFPRILVDGLAPVLNAARPVQVQQSFLSSLLRYWEKMADWTWMGTRVEHLHFLWAAVLLGLCSAWILRRRAWWGLLFFILAYPIILFFITGIPVLPRIWCYLSIFWAIALAEGLALLPLTRIPALAIALSVGIALPQALQAQKHVEINWSYELDREAKQLALFFKERDIQQLYCRVRYEKPLLDFYAIDFDFPLQIAMPFKASKDFRPWESKDWQAVLWDTENPVPQAHPAGFEYKLVWTAGRLELWVKKEN